jgi:hypothetical protein
VVRFGCRLEPVFSDGTEPAFNAKFRQNAKPL